jgi:hypothetical protein
MYVSPHDIGAAAVVTARRPGVCPWSVLSIVVPVLVSALCLQQALPLLGNKLHGR